MSLLGFSIGDSIRSGADYGMPIRFVEFAEILLSHACFPDESLHDVI